MQEQQINKLATLMGIDKLNEDTQGTVKTLLVRIVMEDDFDKLKSVMETLLEQIGADKLPGATQNQLIDNILNACAFIRDGKPLQEVMSVKDFKWDSYAAPIISESKIPKSNYLWPNTELDTKVKQVKKDDYPWRDKEKVHLI